MTGRALSIATALRRWRLLVLVLLTALPWCSLPCQGALLRGPGDPKTVESKKRGGRDESLSLAHGGGSDKHQQKLPPPPPISTASVPLHATDGTHHVYVYVGSPPQRRTLIVDTGSRLMAFPCEPCLSCGRHASESYYDPAISTTDRPSKCGECQFLGLSTCSAGSGGGDGEEGGDDDGARCTFIQRYTEGSSLTAYEMEDIIWLGTDDADESVRMHMEMGVPFAFGCQTSESGLFRTQYADGIVGLAMHQSSILRAFYDAGSIKRNAFALCLDRSGGTFSLGGTGLADLGRHVEPMRYTPLVKETGWFVVEVVTVHVGTVLVTSDARVLDAFNSDKGTIVDSGTTDTYLPKLVAEPVRKAWEDLTGRPYSNREYRFTAEEFGKLPVVTVELRGGVTWEIPPSSYMEPSGVKRKKTPGEAAVAAATEGGKGAVVSSAVVPPPDWDGTRAFTNRMYLDEPKGCVLGGNAMNGHDILFDVTGMTVGIAKADCAYRSSEE